MRSERRASSCPRWVVAASYKYHGVEWLLGAAIRSGAHIVPSGFGSYEIDLKRPIERHIAGNSSSWGYVPWALCTESKHFPGNDIVLDQLAIF